MEGKLMKGMTYPELLNEMTRLAAIDDLTEEDKDRMRATREVHDLYEEHPLGKSMRHWHRLACDQESEAGYLATRGEYTGTHRARAKLYAKTAESIRREIVTGKPHCTVCLGAHENQHCPQRPGARRR
jgi:hypothetical protein